MLQPMPSPRACLGISFILSLTCCADSLPESEGDAPERDAGDEPRTDAADSVTDAAAPPVSMTDPAWQWIEVAGSVCRNGSIAGFHVNRADTRKGVLLYLEGGGACYDMQTCTVNPDSTWQLPPVDGLFARGQAQNPVADWTFVYVPYCSGDHYIGDAEDVAVPGVPGVQQFKGRRNMELLLERVTADYADASRVVLSGTSAGGIGTLMSYRLVQEAFGSTPVTVIDDSGPLLSKEHVAPCLAALRRELWGVERTVIADCGEHCLDEDNWQADYALYNLESIPRASGLIVSRQDAILRSFLGIGSNGGKNDCQGSLLMTTLDAASFGAGLFDLRERIMQRSSRFGTFFPNSMQHGWVVFPGLYTQTAGEDGVTMIDWVRAILDAGPTTHVGP
jgi:hypothetical protein